MKIFLALIQSRKFWLALVGGLVAGYLFLSGQIAVEQFLDAVLALIAVLMGTIAVEDGAAKLGGLPPQQ